MRRIIRKAIATASRRTPNFRGQARLVNTCERFLAPAAVDQVVETGGVRFRIGSADMVERSILYRGAFATDVVNRLVAESTADETYWDVGANIGATLLPIASRLPSARCFGFEPSPSNAAKLHANLALNPELTSRVRVLGLALNDRSGPIDFYPSSEPENSGVGGLGLSHNRVALPLCIWGMRGDDLVASGAVLAPSLVKLDVEGFELEVLRGMERMLRETDRLTIVFEHCVYRFAERSRSPREVTDFMRSLGFELWRIDGAGDRVLSENDLSRDCDVLARKRRGPHPT